MTEPVDEGSDEFAPKNILVTGGSGFIGSHVVIMLVNKYPQYNIINYDKLDYCSTTGNLSPVEDKPNYKFVKGNILSADLVNYILKSEKIDTIMHFAAQTHVDNSFGNSFQFTETNVLGTHVLLEASKAAGIKRFIHVSTDEVKGECDPGDLLDLSQSEVLAPTNPYAATKAAAELIVKSYYRSFNLPVIITRSNNVYGPFQFPEKIIPKFICLLDRGLPCFIHGNGSNRRNYIYASDVANAFDVILHKGQIGCTYNIATDNLVSNLEVAQTLIDLYGYKDQDKYLEFVEDRLFNDRRYYIDPTDLMKLGWKPEVSWREGLQKTMEWYRNSENSNKWLAPVETALVPHPRVGLDQSGVKGASM